MTSAVVLILLGAVGPYPFSAWFEQDPKPVPVAAGQIGNPLDYAAARIGLDARNVELPRGWEGGYRFCCRLPVIDQVSTRPLYLKQRAEETAERFSRPSRLGAVADGFGVLDGVGRTFVEPPGGPDDCRAELVAAGFTPRYATALSELVAAMRWAAAQSRQQLAPGDSAVLAANPGAYLAPDGRRMQELTGNTDGQLEFIARARRVGFAGIEAAGAGLWRAVVRYADATAGFRPADFFADTGRMRDVQHFEFGFGPVVVAGFGNDRHQSDAALLVDLGGNDSWLNNAGGTRRAGGVALAIDHAGNDRYLAPDSSYVQGFGFLGVGILADLAGDDVYQARHFAQGAGILGVGVLWDRAGSDSFSAQTFVQGAGMFGLGLLLDDAGSDVYDCASLGQGAATTLGFGLLSDRAGNDRYRLAVDSAGDALGGQPGYGQGGALSFRAYPWEKKLVAYGGVGLLCDAGGDDDYQSNGWCSQGGSYIMSLGALVDLAGNDRYRGGTAQGSGIHVTSAILVDKQGDDVYEGGFRAGGSGGDRSTGLLIDYAGNDSYRSATSSYGTGCKPFSYSLFIDYQGDDRYTCDRPAGAVKFNDWHSFGGVWPESDPHLWPNAVSLDLGGRDRYAVRNRANNAETHSFGHGIHLDTEWRGTDVIGRVEPPLPPVPLMARGPGMAPAANGVPRLMVGSTLSRFGGTGAILGAGKQFLPQVAERLAVETNRQLNRDLLECLHHWFVQGSIGDGELPLLLPLLSARDAEVRLIIADDLGLWEIRAAESALVAVAERDASAQVRRFALRSLARLESTAALPLARRAAVIDSSEDVRRVAVGLLARVGGAAEVPLLGRVLERDRASSVRCAAADALGDAGDTTAVPWLRAAARTTDVYLQRASGRALCQLGELDGVQLLIGSLAFPSIDAFYNYDRNVPNYLAAFCGHDLPESERYEQANWQAWFDANRDRIDIRANAAAHRALGAAADSLRPLGAAAQVAGYEALLGRFPQSERIGRALSAKLNEVAWAMVTAPAGSPERDTVLGLQFARRAVELGNDANYDDTLIEALVANGLDAEARAAARAALVKFPGNAMLEARRRQLGGD